MPILTRAKVFFFFSIWYLNSGCWNWSRLPFNQSTPNHQHQQMFINFEAKSCHKHFLHPSDAARSAHKLQLIYQQWKIRECETPELWQFHLIHQKTWLREPRDTLKWKIIVFTLKLENFICGWWVAKCEKIVQFYSASAFNCRLNELEMKCFILWLEAFKFIIEKYSPRKVDDHDFHRN